MISLTTLATVDFAVTELVWLENGFIPAETAIADDEGVTTIVVAGLVDVTTISDVTGVLRAGQLRTVEAQAVMIAVLVLKTVISGMTVVVGCMLDEATELALLCIELALELELAVLLMALILLKLPLLSVYSYCIAGLAFVIFTLLTYEV